MLLSQYSRRSFSSVYLRIDAQVGAVGAGVGGVDRAGEGAVGGEGEGAFAFVAVGVGREDRQGDDLAGGAGGEGSIAALLVGGQIADGGALVGGVEDEVALAVFGFDDGHEAGIVDIGGNLDGGDHVVAHQGRVIGIDDAAAVVDGHVEGVDAGHLEHGDEQGGLVFAVAVTIAEDVGGMIGLPAADAALDDEVADVFLDVFGDAAELGVEVGRAGDEGLGLGGDLRRGIGAVGLKRGDPLADGAPLVVVAVDGGIAPLDRHAGGEGSPIRAGGNIAEIEGGHVFDLPAPVVGRDLDGLDGLEVVPGLGVGAAGGQIDFKGLEDHGNAVLNSQIFSWR